MTIEIRMCNVCGNNPSEHQDGTCDACYQAALATQVQEMIAQTAALQEAQPSYLNVGDFSHEHNGFLAIDRDGNFYVITMQAYSKGQQDYKAACRQEHKRFTYADVNTSYFTPDMDGIRRLIGTEAQVEPAQNVIVECVRCREAVTIATTVYAAPYFYKLQAEGTNVTSNDGRLCVFCKEIMQAVPDVEPYAPRNEFEKTLYTCASCGAQHVFSADDIAWNYEQEPVAPCGCTWKAYLAAPAPLRPVYQVVYESVSANGKDTKLSFHDITHHYLTPWQGDIFDGEVLLMSFYAHTQSATLRLSFEKELEQETLETITQVAGVTPHVTKIA